MEVVHHNVVLNTERKKVFNLRNLRKSLKFRPKIFHLILKLRLCIKKKSYIIKKLINDKKTADCNTKTTSDKITKTEIISVDTSTQTDISNKPNEKKIEVHDDESDGISHKENYSQNSTDKSKSPGWVIDNIGEKSIADQVKEVAQTAMQESGMVYVESAGMYYDYKTGYYYSPDLGLYYHTDTGCYYYYSNETKTFSFHSYPEKSAHRSARPKRPIKSKKSIKRVVPDDIDNLTENLSQDENEEPKKKRKKVKDRKIDRKSRTVIENDRKDDNDKKNNKSDSGPESSQDAQGEKKDLEEEDLEDGECSGSISGESDVQSVLSTSTASDDESVAKHHPPCMRIIVRETNVPKLKVGSLYLITKDGGTLGREGEHHALLVRDTNVSRNHLDIQYDMDRSAYFATDLGSKNGTILNGTRMSKSLETSEPIEVVHGSVIQVGETKLLCHIHPGTDTCGHCEPGLIMEAQEKGRAVAYTRTCSVQKQHRLELARLKNKYAPEPLAIEETAYNDRAQARRDQVGSSHHSEKTQASHIDTFITPENKGFKLLEKMGWSKGEGLGKENQGGTEPIPLISNEGKAGLGSTADPVPSAKGSRTLGPATLRLAAKTKMLQPPAKAFQRPFDEDSE